jgi:hypothetical protein
VGSLTRAELLDALDPEGACDAGDEAAPSLDDLLVYVGADELAGVPVEVAGIVLAAREMARALTTTTDGRR